MFFQFVVLPLTGFVAVCLLVILGDQGAFTSPDCLEDPQTIVLVGGCDAEGWCGIRYWEEEGGQRSGVSRYPIPGSKSVVCSLGSRE